VHQVTIAKLTKNQSLATADLGSLTKVKIPKIKAEINANKVVAMTKPKNILLF